MKITKIGHCCLVIEEKGITFLTDPGDYSSGQNDVKGIDCVIISHEHTDHLHIESLKVVLKNNPSVRIVTNKSVGAILDREAIQHEIVSEGQNVDINGISLEGWGSKHAPIYKALEDVENTGYIVNGRFFYPGDAFTLLERDIEILALPVAGPWMKISEAMDYVLKVRPKKCFPVHDGNLRKYGISHRLPKNELTKSGIEFIALEEGQSVDFL